MIGIMIRIIALLKLVISLYPGLKKKKKPGLQIV